MTNIELIIQAGFSKEFALENIESFNNLIALSNTQKEVTIEEAERLGSKGGKPSENEHLLFEAWMKGHCWRIDGEWNGTTYMGKNESTKYFDPYVAHTRQLWATWRDRSVLGK